MSKKVYTQSTGIIHACASCLQCNWNDAITRAGGAEVAKLRSRIYSHVKKTGHKVILETSNSFTYTANP